MTSSIGLGVTVAVHVLILALVLVDSDEQAVPELPPISTRIITENQSEPTPEPIRLTPTLEKPLLHVPQPEIMVAAETPAKNAPVSVSSAPASAPVQAQQVVESLPRFDADYLNNPAPSYPPLSRRLREQGTVLLRVYVLPTGLPEVVELKSSSGCERLDQSALAAVRKWKFTPAQSAGRSVGAWVVVPVAFSLSA